MKESSSESFSAGANIIDENVAPSDVPFDPESEKGKPLPTPENPSIDADAAAGYAETILELSKRWNITNQRKLFDAFVNEFQMQDNLPQARAAFGLGIKLIKAEGGFDIPAAAQPKQKTAKSKPVPQAPDYQFGNTASSETPFGETQAGKEFDGFLAERERNENLKDSASAGLIQNFFGKIKASLFPVKKIKTEAKVEKTAPKVLPQTPEKKKETKYIPGISVSVFRNGKMLNNLMITDMDSSGKFFFKDPQTGEEFSRTFAEIEMWNNQLSEDSVKKATNMRELFDIVEKSGGVMGSSQYYTAEYLIKALTNVRDNRGRLSDVTRAAGLRLKMYELMKNEFSAEYDKTEFANRIN